jgi:hypothetical protein
LSAAVVWWNLMSSPQRAALRLSAAAAACSVLLALGAATVAAAPTTDEQGYVDSTARCTTPGVAVAYGSTETSRVAVCKTQDAKYQYRGVRVSDGAKLVLTATRSDDGAYHAVNDGVEYTVTARSLVVSTGNRVIREESWVDFHGSGAPQAPATPTSATPTPTPTPAPTPTPTTPLPPPLPAEVGGG